METARPVSKRLRFDVFAPAHASQLPGAREHGELHSGVLRVESLRAQGGVGLGDRVGLAIGEEGQGRLADAALTATRRWRLGGSRGFRPLGPGQKVAQLAGQGLFQLQNGRLAPRHRALRGGQGGLASR